jgi:CxxC-x17-CxxC domain-containing protein
MFSEERQFMLTYQDKTLTCRDCRNEFVFTAGEQEFYAQKGFTNEPTRCPDCRRAAKAAREGGSGGYRSGGGGGYASRGERTMYPATCDACGKQTEVPFQPSGNKPVYCSDCFRSQREQRSYNRW